MKMVNKLVDGMDTMTIIRSISPSLRTDLSLCRCVDRESKAHPHNTPLIAEEKEVCVNSFDGALRGRFVEGTARARGGVDCMRSRALI